MILFPLKLLLFIYHKISADNFFRINSNNLILSRSQSTELIESREFSESSKNKAQVFLEFSSYLESP